MDTFIQCQRCTACCRWPGQVKLDNAEIARLATFVGLAEREFIDRYTRLRPDRCGLALVDKPNGECVFLEGAACRVQPVKPQQCRDFPNLWRFAGYELVCRGLRREVPPGEWERLVVEATGRTPPLPRAE